ncbi:MAG TPA: hypothetical protein VHY37_01395 [Tepidisphaeraceae bacterium]|jgi:hypothetical protein|nr:hypothetical protein [Tepidisphaeraceae bacterium]
MVHLLKLAIYALVGYALYEFIQGVLEENRGMAQTEQSRPGRSPVPSGGRR